MNEKGKTMTVRDVLETTLQVLGNISVPMAFKQQIADPIGNAMQNLQMCVNAMDQEARARQEAEEAEEDGRENQTE